MATFSINLFRQFCVVMTLLASFLPFHHRVNCQLPAVFPTTWTIGAILSDHEMCNTFKEFIHQKNIEPDAVPIGVTLNATCIRMNSNPIVAAEMVCESLLPSQVYVTIASHSQNGELSPMSVSFTCAFYKIPVIGISVRDSYFSDENIHTSFIRTVPPYSEQSDLWVEMLQLLEYKQIVFIHSIDQEGRAMLSRFQGKLESKDVEVKIERSIPYIAGYSNFMEVLSQVKNLSSKVIMLYASESDAEKIYNDADRLNMTETDYAWIVTEQALQPENTPIGVLGLQLQPNRNTPNVEQRHLHDSINIVAKAVRALVRDGVNITEAPSSCDKLHEEAWEGGPDILEYLKSQKLTPEESKTIGRVQFNEFGDRMFSHYQVYNKQTEGLIPIGSGKDSEVNMDVDSIIWPGNRHVKPKGIKITTHLRVVTDPAVPFVYTTPRVGDSCEDKTPCSRHNESDDTYEHFCCYGYCMDLLEELSVKVNFTYTLHLSPDGVYGSYDRHVQSGDHNLKTWNGMIGELINGKADMIVTPLTINPERALSIDFTKPFKYQGMTILVKKTVKDSNLASFLQPFQDTLWILVGLSVHVVALVLYLLDRFSPFGRFKLAKSDDTEEDALNLSGAVWFAWGVLLNSGIGEGTPRSFSARVLGMVWAGFAMIIVASYTANLAAFLVLDRPVAAISGIDDARLRNPHENFKYATVKDSAVAMYFKRQVELSTMYRTMESRFYNNEREAIQAVKDGALEAFIWDSSRLEYEAANDCDLVTAGELFGRSGYGIGLPKRSPWTEEISLKILSFHETGFMEQLDNKWILVSDTTCPERDAAPATLGLTNMAGVFMMVAGGIVAGVFLIFIEIAYKRHRGLKEKELELAKTAADRWRGNIEKRRTLRRTLLQQQQERNKAKNGTTESPAHAARLTHYSPSAVPAGYQPVATNIKSSSSPPV